MRCGPTLKATEGGKCLSVSSAQAGQEQLPQSYLLPLRRFSFQCNRQESKERSRTRFSLFLQRAGREKKHDCSELVVQLVEAAAPTRDGAAQEPEAEMDSSPDPQQLLQSRCRLRFIPSQVLQVDSDASMYAWLHFKTLCRSSSGLSVFHCCYLVQLLSQCVNFWSSFPGRFQPLLLCFDSFETKTLAWMVLWFYAVRLVKLCHLEGNPTPRVSTIVLCWSSRQFTCLSGTRGARRNLFE